MSEDKDKDLEKDELQDGGAAGNDGEDAAEGAVGNGGEDAAEGVAGNGADGDAHSSYAPTNRFDASIVHHLDGMY